MTQSRNERLADHFLRAAGVAGVYVEAGRDRPSIGVAPAVEVRYPAGRFIYCCARRAQAEKIIEQAAPIVAGIRPLAAAVAAVHEVAACNGIGLTPHEIVIRRAMEAVNAVNSKFDKMRAAGELRGLNASFKAQRQTEGGIAIYRDYLDARKAEMLEALATVKK